METTSEKNGRKNNELLNYYLKTGGTLLIISAFIAVLIAAVNMITADKIAENKESAMKLAMSDIFINMDSAEFLNIETEPPVSGVYKVMRGTSVLGYCAHVMPSGFGGTIEMMVGLELDGTIAGVKIVALSETPGLGSNVNNAGYLAGYKGLRKNPDGDGKLKIGSDIDAIAGATVSSKAVLSGVNAALSVAGLTAETITETEAASNG